MATPYCLTDYCGDCHNPLCMDCTHSGKSAKERLEDTKYSIERVGYNWKTDSEHYILMNEQTKIGEFKSREEAVDFVKKYL